MKASELRKGNYVNHLSKVIEFINCIEDAEIINVEIAKISGDILEHLWLEDIKPIPITEQWLLDFGYECSYKDIDFASYDLTKNKFFGFNIQSNKLKGNSLTGFRFGEGLYLSNIKYVHQLQNLYFALAGEELTIKEKVK